jgi:protein-disulfide isomerase
MNKILNTIAFAAVILWIGILLARTTQANTRASEPAAREVAVDAIGSRAYSRGGLRIGPEDAALTIVMYVNHACGWCADMEEKIRVIRTRFPDHVAVVYKDLLLNAPDPVIDVHMAARCANDVQHLEAFIHAVHSHRERVTYRGGWRDLAREAAPDDTAAIAECVISERYRRILFENTAEAQSLGFRSTPTSLIGMSTLRGSPEQSVLDSIVESELALALRR